MEDDPDTSQTDGLVELPVSDTPIVKRNKELRKGKGRRSSLDQRGKRASSIGTGFEALPHADVPSHEYYRHISKDLSEPLRIKQLLLWASSKALEEQRKKYGETEEASEAAIARSIVQEVLNELLANKVSVSWYQRPPDAVIPNKPHPQNLKNAQLVDELSAKLTQLHNEEAAWRAVAANSVSSDKSILSFKKAVESIDSKQDLDKQDSPLPPDDAPELPNISKLKPKFHTLLDMLAENIHTLHSLTNAGPEVRSSYGRLAAQDFIAHRKSLLSFSKYVDTMNLLRLLSEASYKSSSNESV